jgi:hypothetical protein
VLLNSTSSRGLFQQHHTPKALTLLYFLQGLSGVVICFWPKIHFFFSKNLAKFLPVLFFGGACRHRSVCWLHFEWCCTKLSPIKSKSVLGGLSHWLLQNRGGGDLFLFLFNFCFLFAPSKEEILGIIIKS